MDDHRPLVTRQQLVDVLDLGTRAVWALVMTLLGWVLFLTLAVPVLALSMLLDVFITYAGHQQRNLLRVYWPLWRARRAIEFIDDQEERDRVFQQVYGRYNHLDMQ